MNDSHHHKNKTQTKNSTNTKLELLKNIHFNCQSTVTFMNLNAHCTSHALGNLYAVVKF